jgi:hypothetical protein
MFRLRESDSGAVVSDEIELLVGWRYDQIITSAAFGLKSARDSGTELLIDQLRFAREIGDEEVAERLHAELEERSLPVAEEERDRATKEEYSRVLDDLNRSRGEEL